MDGSSQFRRGMNEEERGGIASFRVQHWTSNGPDLFSEVPLLTKATFTEWLAFQGKALFSLIFLLRRISFQYVGSFRLQGWFALF